MATLPRRVLVYSPSQAPLCRSCRLQTRRFASSAAPPKPPTSGLAPLLSRRLLAVSGPDAAKFLHGIVTSSLVSKDGAPRTDPFYSGFLNATGRVVNDVFIYPHQHNIGDATDGGYLIEVDAQQLASLAKYVRRYKLRANIALRTLEPEQASVWHAWDDSGKDAAVPSGNSSRIVLQDPRAPGLGYRIIQLNQTQPELDLEQATEDAYTIRRYLHGVAEGQDEILAGALPLESNMDVMNGIDFHKGCYVGQELTIRTRHRGVVRKRILPCVIYEPDKAAPQRLTYEPQAESPETITADMIPIETSIGRFEKKGRTTGKWLKGVGNIGLGLCRLETMTDIVLPGEQTSPSQPLDGEFKIEWGDEENKSTVKVKAFVPDWLRAGLDQAANRSSNGKAS
ncbi:hypothetical protein S40288_03336 [Stachybotrys chartarum IBT 40288]|nr:hypothetical protein S40288_03336 [Stachybotrys chartarum IBT 40288]